MPISRVIDNDFDVESLKARARRQDIERAIRADDEHFRVTGENIMSNVVPMDVIAPLHPYYPDDQIVEDGLRLARAAFERRQKELEEREMQEALDICRKRIRRSIALLDLDF